MASAADRLMQHIRALVDPGPTTETDGQLLGHWADQRDGRAFAGVVGRHGALVWRVVWNVLRQREDAEDAFQATFLILARKAATLQMQTSIAGWLYQTAHRLALKARTATTRRLHREERAARKTVPQPLEELSVREARTILDEELERLGTVYREPLLLCLYEGATQDEAAKRLGCSLKTLKRRLERGRGLLGRRLARRGLAPASALAVTLCSRSEVPAGLAAKTVAAAAQFASGQALSGTAVVLAEGVLRGLMVKKMGAYLMLFLAIGSITLGAGFAYAPTTSTQVAKRQRFAEPEALAMTEALLANASGLDNRPRLDPNGDALPPGAINRLGSSRLRHVSGVTGMLYTPDGKAIASTSNNFVYLWDVATGKQRWRLPMAGTYFPFPAPALAASGDGKRLAVLTDLEFAVIETDTGKKLARHEWPKHQGFVRCLAISPDLGMLAQGWPDDGTVRLFDAVTGQETLRLVVGDKAMLQLPEAFEFSADGKALYVITRQKRDVIGFDTHTGKAVQTLELPKTVANPYRLIRSPDHHMLAVLERGIVFRITDKIVLWDLKAGKQLHLIEKDLISISWGAFSPDNSLFAVVGTGPDIVLFDTATGQEHSRLQAPPFTSSLTFAPDAKTLAAGEHGGCITFWDVANGKRMPPSPEPNAAARIQFANKGKEIVSIRDSVDWWEVASAKSLRHVSRDPEWYYVSSVSPDGKLLVASLFDGDMVLIDAVTGRRLRNLDGHKILNPVTAFSPDSTRLYSAGRELSATPGLARFDPRVIILDVASGKRLNELQSEADHVDRLAVSPNGRLLASAAFNSDLRDYGIRVWEVATGKLLHRLTPRRGAVIAMVFSADSSRLVSVGGEPGYSDKPGDAQLWDVVAGKELRAFTGHREYVSCVAMTPDGRMLASSSSDKTLRLWEVATGAERSRILGHDGEVFSVDFSPDGSLLAAASSDAPVYLWNPYALEIPRSLGRKLAKEEREKLWQSLADTDATVGFQAVCELITHPAEATAILEGGWKQLPRATSKQMRGWVEDLGSDQFSVRKTATAELERFTTGHEDLLRDALQEAASLEARQRLEKILGRFDPERLRRTRMLEVLGQLRTQPARQFLQALAEQTEDAVMAREAAAGLKRLGGGK
ncbi:MAG TPA: sigma-70 family RNA polymerase sigma factor [Gemmataceae bacterium]|nr:sigma-70 family RNA polymerase sigma factor [Gemmataceae bacterium]